MRKKSSKYHNFLLCFETRHINHELFRTFNMIGQKEGDLAPQSSLVGTNGEQKFDLYLVCVVVFNRLVQEGSLIAMGKWKIQLS